ncbi:hypothetical protein HK098_000783 [Nowakowskiella sp. JEL0407]|nr:hypothetical protein HK098_000783 [Nowakowskiella sp. JEL0407]
MKSKHSLQLEKERKRDADVLAFQHLELQTYNSLYSNCLTELDHSKQSILELQQGSNTVADEVEKWHDLFLKKEEEADRLRKERNQMKYCAKMYQVEISKLMEEKEEQEKRQINPTGMEMLTILDSIQPHFNTLVATIKLDGAKLTPEVEKALEDMESFHKTLISTIRQVSHNFISQQQQHITKIEIQRRENEGLQENARKAKMIAVNEQVQNSFLLKLRYDMLIRKLKFEAVDSAKAISDE